MADKDFLSVAGALSFEEGQTFATLEIQILKSEAHDFECDERFKVFLSDASPGVMFDPDSEGGELGAVCEVVIVGCRAPSLHRRLLAKCFNRDQFAVGLETWGQQFESAMYCNGTAEDQAGAGIGDWCMHCLSLTWKVVFAFVPPPSFCGGWVCFVVALAMIGCVTAIVADMASLLGCCLDIPDDITAITLVALGTSLPDTFASKVAAQQDENADNSIGNVTGSNSVNVFLGLGLPWSLAAVYWENAGPTDEWLRHTHKGRTFQDLYLDNYPGGGFIVPAGSLSFSVTVFTICAISCVALLFVRRRLYGGELGGPKSAQMRDSAILALLWGVYIVASIITSLGNQ